MLKEIFTLQKRLMGKYRGIAEEHYKKVFGVTVAIDPKAWKGTEDNLHTKTGNVLVVDMLNSAIHEISEAVQVLKNWKAWKQTEMEADSTHFKEELIDAVHFMVEAMILSGMTAEDVYEIYTKKNKVNQFRQRTNY